MARSESVGSLDYAKDEQRNQSRNSLKASQNSLKMDGDAGQQVKFTKDNDGGKLEESAVEIGNVEQPFAGMGKEELMKYANDPFWVRLRWTLFILFWLGWFGMLAGAIAIIVLAPKCPPPAPLEYWQKTAIYHVYPKLFQDAVSSQEGVLADGVGDLKGGHLHSIMFITSQYYVYRVEITS